VTVYFVRGVADGPIKIGFSPLPYDGVAPMAVAPLPDLEGPAEVAEDEPHG
jgi:hypothetical protein